MKQGEKNEGRTLIADGNVKKISDDLRGKVRKVGNDWRKKEEGKERSQKTFKHFLMENHQDCIENVSA